MTASAIIFTVGLVSGCALGIAVSLWLPRRRTQPAQAPTYHKHITVRRRAL